VALTRARYACHVYALDPERLRQKNAKDADVDPHRAPLDTMIERLLDFAEPPETMKHVLWSRGPWRWEKRKYEPGSADDVLTAHVLIEPEASPFEFKYSFSTLAKSGTFTALEERAASDEAELDDAGVVLA